MQVVHPICCGINVHQAQLTACLRRVDADGQVTQEVRACATTYDALLTLGTWLTEEQCPVAALESTGVYWRPVYHVLEGMVEVLVGNAAAPWAQDRQGGCALDRGALGAWPHPSVRVLSRRPLLVRYLILLERL